MDTSVHSSGEAAIASQTVSRPIAFLLIAVAVMIAGCASDQPEALRRGRAIYGDMCSVCHGARGQGEVGPSLENVLETWPLCTDQVEWIAVGSEGWQARYGQTYGASQQPIKGGMPAHQDRLTLEDMRRVAAFERVEYGGLEAAAALEQCEVVPD